jgi:hypothetical protein
MCRMEVSVKDSLIPLFVAGLIVLAGCAPLPAAPHATSTTTAPADTATTIAVAPTIAAELTAPPMAEPMSIPAATTVPTHTSTAVLPTVAPSDRAPTVAPGLTTPPAAPAGWSTYSDAALGVSLAIPPEWELCQNTGQSRLFCLKQAEPTGPAFPRFYVTVLPQGFTNADASAYNFISEEHVKALMALPVGSSRATNDLPAYSTFTRLADTTVNDLPAVTIENSKVWEGGPDTKDRRALVTVGTSVYMFGTYYETPAQIEAFGRVLGGVRIAAAGGSTPEVGAACPGPTGDLQRLVDPVHGYCLTYPAEYKVEKPNPSGTLLVIGGLLNAGDPRALITVTDTQGITLEETARRVESENAGFDVKRSQTTVAGETAVVFDGLPGEDVNRRVFFVHDGLLYYMYFAPADPANADIYGRLQTLYTQVVGSFMFIPRSTAAVDECLSPSSTTRLLSDPQRGFCLLYPVGFKPTESADGGVTLAADSPGGANRSKVVVQVKDAGGKTAEQFADELVAEAQREAPGVTVERPFGLTIGYEWAQLLEEVPGPEPSRHVLAVHSGKIYHLTFTPDDASDDTAQAQMQALYDLVVRSFRFITPGG